MKLSSYQTHKLIKNVFPDAHTVYERENPNGQMTFEEYVDMAKEALEQEYQMNMSSMINRLI